MNRIVLLLCASLASPAWAAKSAVIDGKRVVLGKRVRGVPLFDVSDLKFYEAVEPKTGQACTVVSGNLTSRLNSKYFVVTVEVLLVHSVQGAHAPGAHSKMIAVVDRPEPNRPVRFVARGRRWKLYTTTTPSTLAYHVTVSFTRWRPSEPE